MKLLCLKNDMLDAVNTVSKAVASGTTMNILECILIETCGDDRIRLTANDTELGIETVIPGTTVIPGKIALKAKLFYEMIRKLPDSELIIDTEDNGRTHIYCEEIYFGIMGQEGDDFSKLPDIDKEYSLSMSQFDLKEVIRQTIFSVSDNTNSRIMTGELFHIEGSRLTVTALDGHRVSVRTIDLACEYETMEVIVPGKTLSEISKILPGEAGEEVSIYITDKHILFEFGETLVVSRLIEGNFFNITNMISADYETKITVNRIDFLRCLDRSTLFVRDSSKRPVVLTVSDGDMNIGIHSEVGQMNDKIEVAKEGKDIMIGFDPKYLVDALRVIDDEDISVYMMNPVAPCIIRNEERTYHYMVLPINVNGGVF